MKIIEIYTRMKKTNKNVHLELFQKLYNISENFAELGKQYKLFLMQRDCIVLPLMVFSWFPKISYLRYLISGVSGDPLLDP